MLIQSFAAECLTRVPRKCGWKYAQACKPFQGKCTVSRGTACGGPVVLK